MRRPRQSLFALCCCALLISACGGKSTGHSPADAGSDAGSDAGCTPFDAGPVDHALAMQGLAIIEQRKCQTCHGETLSGNNNGVQVSGTNITQYPPNLSADLATGLGCWTNDQVVRAILYGVDNEGAVMCPPMPQWADAGMTESDARAVVAFLRTLPPVNNQVAQGPDCTCSTSAGCTQGLVCTNQICEIGVGGGQDAGSVDAGNTDAGNTDAGNTDAGNTDAGNTDAGDIDAGDIDAGDIDAGNADAGDSDAGDIDAGEVDAGDAGAGMRQRRWSAPRR